MYDNETAKQILQTVERTLAVLDDIEKMSKSIPPDAAMMPTAVPVREVELMVSMLEDYSAAKSNENDTTKAILSAALRDQLHGQCTQKMRFQLDQGIGVEKLEDDFAPVSFSQMHDAHEYLVDYLQILRAVYPQAALHIVH